MADPFPGSRQQGNMTLSLTPFLQSQRRSELRACPKRSSRLIFKSSVFDNEQVTHQGTGEVPVWIKEQAVAE
jgi:hypothetical protein